MKEDGRGGGGVDRLQAQSGGDKLRRGSGPLGVEAEEGEGRKEIRDPPLY